MVAVTALRNTRWAGGAINSSGDISHNRAKIRYIPRQFYVMELCTCTLESYCQACHLVEKVHNLRLITRHG